MNDHTGGTSDSERSSGALDAVDATVKPAQQARAVEIEFVDTSGSNFAVLLGRPKAADLALRLIEVLAADEGKSSPKNRMHEAQLLLRALIGPHGRRARWVAQRLGVVDSTVSQWRSGRTIPTKARLDQLRDLVTSIVESGGMTGQP